MTDEPDAAALAEAQAAAGQWESALATAAAGLARSPEEPRLLAVLLRVLRAQRRHGEAVDVAQRLLVVAPSEPYAYRLAMLALLDVQWVDEAIGLAVRAVQLDPGNAVNHLSVARAWAQSSRPEAPARQLAAARQAVVLGPHSPDAHVQVGAAWAANGQPAAARAAYQEALRLDPQNAAALNNLAVLDLRAGRPGSAARYLADALAVDPQDGTALHNLDAVAVRVVRRLAWWMALSPVPGLACSASGAVGAGRVLALASVLGAPVTVARAWRALTDGQRTHLRGLPRRVRTSSWLWPLFAAVAGGWAVVAATVGPPMATAGSARGYAVVLACAALLRVLTVLVRPSARAEVAGWGERMRRSPQRRGRPSDGAGRTVA